MRPDMIPTVTEALALPVIDGLSVSWQTEDGMRAIDAALVSEGSQRTVAEAGLMLTHLLLLKNAAYGDAALTPLVAFGPGLTVRQRLATRMDDKLTRIIRGAPFGSENERVDLAGYLLLDYIAAHEFGRHEGN